MGRGVQMGRAGAMGRGVPWGAGCHGARGAMGRGVPWGAGCRGRGASRTPGEAAGRPALVVPGMSVAAATIQAWTRNLSLSSFR